MYTHACWSVRACVRACVRRCARACVRRCARAPVRACACEGAIDFFQTVASCCQDAGLLRSPDGDRFLPRGVSARWGAVRKSEVQNLNELGRAHGVEHHRKGVCVHVCVHSPSRARALSSSPFSLALSLLGLTTQKCELRCHSGLSRSEAYATRKSKHRLNVNRELLTCI